MVKTRSKDNKRDENANLTPKKLIQHQGKGNPSSVSKASNSNKKTCVPTANVTSSSSPLRRSKRETPTKKMAHLSGTAPNSSPSPNKKTTATAKMKSVSAVSSSSPTSTKNVSKQNQKVPAETENLQTRKRNLNSISTSSSPSTEKKKEREKEKDKEEGPPTKRQRVLLHAKAYKELFKPHSKITKPPTPVEKAQSAAPDRVAITQVDTQAIVDVHVQEASCLRGYSCGSKSANEATASAPEANTTKKVSENNAGEPVVSVAEDRPESASDGMECEILSAPRCNTGDPCSAGSTGERKMDPIEVVIAGDDARHISEEHQADEEDPQPNACLACRKPGILLCCEGKSCKRTFHLSCLDPPLQSSPPGAWLCISCIQKKIQYGVCAICDGIECIWDVKDERTENGKMYLVKYKNLAHVHNRWVPEAEIAVEAPELLSKFNWRMQKEKNPLRWKQEWTEPQRLLMKRSLMSEQVADEFYNELGNSLPFCNAEWLVKWRELGYEHATWELETSPFLCTEDGTALIKAFESRREQARLSSYPERISSALEVKHSALERLEKLPDGFPLGLASEHLHSLNQLRLFWHKSQNTVFIDDRERVIKTILFIMSVIEDICRPILIVTSNVSLPLWDSKFQKLAPSINAVSYTGTKPVRKLIQDVEFYEEGGCIMFQVLLSHPDAVVEDFEMLDSIGWEAVIVDECQNLRISKHLEKFKNLSADFRLLLLSSPLKDNASEYANMLSYLDPNHVTANSCLSKSGMLARLKEKLAHHVAYERKDETSKVTEYWVPARFSKVQLELYCSTLLSNYFALRSSSKIDQVGALRDMLISLRKCCDHPYLVYQELQAALTKEKPVTEILNIGVYASGKLLLLDKLLHEMRVRGLRVLIVFQAGGGSGRNQIGDFLDDFLRQRFGADAYEHVERGLLMSKKQIAMNNFNDKSKGRFVFLIENRACQPSLKLSSVDAVLIYDSDWNPMNDTRILQRISIQPKQVPVFRFYSPCAVEEKVLNLARQDVFLDSTLQGVVPAVSHSLLSWGAEHLFSLLHQLHLQPDDAFDNYRAACFSAEDMAFMNTVLTEIMDKVCWNSTDANTASLLIEAQPTGDSYLQESGPLIGEKEGASSLHGDPPVFWSALLEGKSPQWKFIQSDGPLQRIRRKVRPFDSSENPLVTGSSGGGETEESKKKKKKNVGDASMSGTGVMPPRGKAGTNSSARKPSAAISTWDDLSDFCAGPSEQEISNQAAPLPSDEGGANLRSAQKGIHLLLEPQLFNLCQSSGLPDYVKTMAGMLLEYVMNNFKVDDGGDEAILQTLVISLCWRAASLFKHWVDPLQLTALASEKLHYNCKADVVESVYCRLRALKVEFQEKADAMVARQIPSVRFYNKLFRIPKQEVIILPESPSLEEEKIGTPAPVPGQSRDVNETEVEQDNAKEELLKAQLDLIEKVCTRREEALLAKQQVEVSELEQFKEREEMCLIKEHRSQLERLSGSSMEEMVVKVKEEFGRKMRAFQAHVGRERERLQVLHTSARELERSIKEKWVENSKLGNLEEDFDDVPSSDSCEFTVQEFNWDPPTSLIHENDFAGRAGNGGISPGQSNHTSTPQDTGVVAEEMPTVAAAQQGSTAENQHREGETCSDESKKNTMMEQETRSIAGLTTRLVKITESISSSENAESGAPAEAAESGAPAEAAESAAHAEAVESTPPVEAAELTPHAEAAESTLPEAAELTSDTEAAESMLPAEAAELTSHAEAAESTPSLRAATLPAAVGFTIANRVPVAYTSDAVVPADPLPSVPRDVTPHFLTSQNLGTVSPNQVPSPVLLQNLGMQSTHVNVSNVVCNGLITENENGTSVRVRSEANYDGLWQMLPLASPMVFPHGLHADPLRNELTRIKQQEDILTRRHEAKRMQRKMEMEEEIERLRRKYEEILQEEENTFQQQKQHLGDVYKKVFLNQSLAEEFRAKFIEHRAPSASSAASIQFRSQVPGPRSQLPLQQRGPQQIQRAPTTVAAAAAPRQGSGIANGSLGQITNSNRPSSVAAFRIPSTSPLRASAAASPSTSRAPFSPGTLPSRSGSALRTEHRAPAPHLARARPHVSTTVPSLTPTRTPGSTAVTTMEHLRSLLAARLQDNPTACSQNQAQNQTENLPVESLGAAAVNQIQTQNLSSGQVALRDDVVETLGAAAVNQTQTQNLSSGQVALRDDVVCLSDDD